ncbi:uncharacterized protein LOC141641840 [Silene latifolia]|uniref:uncharacterized protein LOC141641840 n=1 Tax=Silene latifolia TaxID=37657 RepID=UPI003D76EC72
MVRPFPTHNVTVHFQPTPLAAVGLFIYVFSLVALCAKRATKSPKGTYVDDNLDTMENTNGSPMDYNKVEKSPMSTPKRLMSNSSNVKVNKKNNEEIIDKEENKGDMVEEAKDMFGEGGLWQKNILLGEKCKPLEYSGVIYYDNYGNRISEIPRSPSYMSGNWKEICKTKELLKPGYSSGIWLAHLQGYSVSFVYEWLRRREQKVGWTKNALPIKDRLLRFGISHDDQCCICHSATETMVHLFQNCRFAVAILTKVAARLNIPMPAGNAVIWQRNQARLEGLIAHPDYVVDQVFSNVLVVLTLWLMLALSHASAYDGYGSSNGHNKYGYGLKNHKGKSHKSPKNHKGKNHHGPKTHPTPPTSPSNPPTPSTPSTPPPTPRPIGLQVGFYKGLCPNNVDIEAILIKKVQEHFAKDVTIVAALLRMQFHDCFVHVSFFVRYYIRCYCDASILIDGPSSEKTAFPNVSVRGYDLIDILKSIAEAVCPGIVSCSDIIAIATKEVIKLGGGPDYAVQTGRNDGLVSNAADVNLPSPFFSVSESISAFGAKKFTPEEMVVLLGCHTVGTSNCAFFQDRLYEGTGQFDKNMDSNLRRQLIATCPQGTTSNNVTFLDQNPQSSNKLDNSFYDQILKQRGILSIDQALARDSLTKDFVLRLAQSSSFFNSELAKAMVKLQALDVHLGNKGEVRKTCNRFN